MKMSRISVRLRWIAGTRMCDGRSWPSWTIISARSVSQTSMPLEPERLVELDLLGRHRLDLDDLGRAGRRGRCEATIAFASAASRAQWTVPPAAVTAASSCSRRAGRSRRTSSLIAAPASRSSSQSARSATAAARFVRIVVGRPAEVRAELRRRRARPAPPPGTAACRGTSARDESARPVRASRPAVLARSTPSPVEARISARCMTRTGDRAATAARRCASGTTCRPRSGPRRPRPATSSTLSMPIATDVSAFLTANVPPNPQHASDRGRSTRVRPSTAASSRRGRSPTPSSRIEWQVGWSATACGKRAPTSVTPRTSTRNSLSSWTRGADRGDLRRQGGPGVRAVGQPGDERVVVADHRRARAGRRDDRVVAGERVDEPLDERDAGLLVAGVEVHLAAARLLRRELDLVAEPAQQPDDRLADLGEQQVVVAGDEQRDHAWLRPCRGRAPGAARSARTSWVAANERAQRLEVAGEQAARARLDEHVAERGRLDRTGDDRQPAGVGGQLAEQLVARAAADQVDDLDRSAGQPRRVADGPAEGARRGCRGCTGRAPAAWPGSRWSRRRQAAAIRAGMSPGGRNDGSSGSMTGPPAGSSPAATSSAGRSLGAALELPGPERLLEQPQAHDVAQVADPAVDAALVGEVRRAGSPRSATGASSSTPTSAPGAAGDVGEVAVRRPARRRPPRPCRATRRGPARSPARDAGLGADRRPEAGRRRRRVRRAARRSAAGSPSASISSVSHVRRRTSSSAGRRGVGHLADARRPTASSRSGPG